MPLIKNKYVRIGTKIFFIIIGILFVLGVALYSYNKHEDSLAKKRISPAEIQFEDLVFIKKEDAVNGYKLIGRVKNNSKKYTLNSLYLKIKLSDCIKPENCEIVGEDSSGGYYTIPPGQARGIDLEFWFNNLPEFKGSPQWDYLVYEIKGH